MNQETEKKRWYEKTFIVILLLFVLYPLGLYGLIKNKKTKKAIKILLSIIFGFCFIVFAISLASTGDTETGSKNQSDASDTTAMQDQSVPVSTSDINSSDRLEKIKELNAFAKENDLKAKFGVDPNDDTTLCFYRESTMTAKNIDFKMSVFGYGTTIEELKEVGFNKVRVYSSKDGYKEYSLVIL